MADDLTQLATIRLRAIDEATAILTAVEAKVNELSHAISNTAIVTGALSAGVLAFSADAASRFEDDLQKIAGNTGASRAEMEAMRQSVLDLGSQGPASLDDIASGFEHAANLGYHFAAAQEIVTAGWKAAIATGAKVSDTVNALGTVMRDWQEPLNRSTADMSILLKAAADGNIRLNDLANSFNRVGEIAGASHQSIAQIAAGFSTLTQATHDGALAQTQWVRILQSSLAPTDAQKKIMGDLAQTTGIDLLRASEEAARGQITLAQYLTLAREATRGQNSEIQALFGGMRGGLGAIDLFNQGWATYQKTLGDVNSASVQSGASLNRLFDDMQKTFGAELKTFENNVHIIAITLGTTLLPALSGITVPLVAAAGAVRELTGAFPGETTAVLGAVAGFGLLELSLRGGRSVLDFYRVAITETFGTLSREGALIDRTRKAIADLGDAEVVTAAKTQALNAAEGQQAAVGLAAMTSQASLATTEVAGLGTVVQSTSGLFLPMSVAADEAAVSTTAAAASTSALAGAVGVLMQPEVGLPLMAFVLGGIAYEKIPAVHDAANRLADTLKNDLTRDIHGVNLMLDALKTHLGDIGTGMEGAARHSDTFRHALDGIGAAAYNSLTKVHELLNAVPDWAKVAATLPIPGVGEIAAFHALSQLMPEQETHVRTETELLTHMKDKLNEAARAQQELAARVSATNESFKVQRAALIDYTGAFNQILNAGIAPMVVALHQAEATIHSFSHDALADAHQMADGMIAEIGRIRSEVAKPLPELHLTRPQAGPALGSSTPNLSVGTADVAMSLNAASQTAFATLTGAIHGLPPEFRGMFSAETADFQAKLAANYNDFVARYNAENQRHEGVDKQRNDEFHAGLRQVWQQAKDQLAAEQQRYLSQMQSINQGHEQRLTLLLNNFGLSFQTMLANYQAGVASLQQQSEGILQAHRDQLQQLHDAYLTRLDAIHGKHAAERKAALDQAYQRSVGLEDRNYQHGLSVVELHGRTMTAAFTQHVATMQTALQQKIDAEKKSYDEAVTKLDAAHRNHETKIAQHLQQHVHDLRQALDKHISDEAANHQRLLDGLWTAFEHGANRLADSMSKGLSSSVFLSTVQADAQKAYNDAVATGTRHVLLHGRATQADIDAIQRAKEQLDRLSAAQASVEQQAGVTVASQKAATQQVDAFTLALTTATAAVTGDVNRIALIDTTGTGGQQVPLSRAGQADQRGEPTVPFTRLDAALSQLTQDYITLDNLTKHDIAAKIAAAQAEGDLATQVGLEVPQALKSLALDLNTTGSVSAATAQQLTQAANDQQRNILQNVQATAIWTGTQINAAIAAGDLGTAFNLLSKQDSSNLGQSFAALQGAFRTGSGDVAALTASYQQNKQAVDADTAATISAYMATGQYAAALSGRMKEATDASADATAKLTIAYHDHTAVTQGDIDAAKRAREATEQWTQDQWRASYVTASLSEQMDMLRQKVQPLISAYSTQASMESSVSQAQLGVIAAQSAVQVDELHSLITAVQDVGSIITAESNVATAVGNYQLDAIKAQGSILQAQAAIAAATSPEALKVAQDQLRIAIDTALAAQRDDAWKIRLAQDSVRLAQDKATVDAANAVASHQTAMDHLKVAQDGVQLAIDQAKLTGDTNQGIGQILELLGQQLGFDGASVGYLNMVNADLSSIQGDQRTILTDQRTLAEDTAKQAQIEAEGALKIQQDQLAIAEDTRSAAADSQAGQIQIAKDQNQLTIDQINAQKATTSAVNANTSAIVSTLQAENAELRKQVADLLKLEQMGLAGLERVDVSGRGTQSMLNGWASDSARQAGVPG